MPISPDPGTPGGQRFATGFADIAGYAGVDATGVSECASAINTALTTIAADGKRAYASGTFKIGSTVTISASVDFSDATFNFTAATGTAIRVGSNSSGTQVYYLRADLPQVAATLKVVGSGWSAVSGTVGVDLGNLYDSTVTVPRIQGFETNLRCYGKGTGCVYNRVDIGLLDNGKINHLLDADATGWCNENLFTVGRMSHESAEGSDVSGTRHIKTAVCTNTVNNNVWIKPCVEGNTAEYHLEIGGTYNRFIHGRYEATTPKVQWQSDAASNFIDGGYNSGAISETWVSGAAGSNGLRGHLREYVTKSGNTTGVVVLENQSSDAYPADVIMPAGSRVAAASPVTAYTVSRGARYSNWKATADTYPRVQIDTTTGRVYLGPGTAALTGYLRSGGDGYLQIQGMHLEFPTDNTYDVGIASERPRDVRLGRNLIVGGAIDHDGSTVGFYGTAPIAKQTGVAVSAAGIHAALVALGLIGA